LINAGALDNSTGVDCSEHTLNAKVLRSGLEYSGELGRAERDGFLAEIADDVTGPVLNDNYLLALVRNASISPEYWQAHLLCIQSLESRNAGVSVSSNGIAQLGLIDTAP
jgi:NAD-specific glutamate dehydrogenase